MNHRTTFRLLLKLAGILLVSVPLNPVIGDLIAYAQAHIYEDAWFADDPTASKFDELFALGYQLLMTLAPTLFGLYLVFGGEWLVDKLLPLRHPFCSNCGHRLRDANAKKCPECGAARVIHAD